MKTLQLKFLSVIVFGILCLASSAKAGMITTLPDIPPLGGIYSATSGPAIFGGPALQLMLSNSTSTIASILNRQIQGVNEIENFLSNLSSDAEVFQNGISVGTFPIQSNGQATSITFGRAINITGTFQTEMLSLSASGVTPVGTIMIRESPTLQSLGQTTVSDLGGGLFQIDSFFDVFTELSIDGGATWLPDTNGPSRTVLNVVPEPSSLGLLTAGLVGAIGFIRREKRVRCGLTPFLSPTTLS